MKTFIVLLFAIIFCPIFYLAFICRIIAMYWLGGFRIAEQFIRWVKED